MSRLKALLVAGPFALAVIPGALAADMPKFPASPALPPPAPSVSADFNTGWYLRGDLGGAWGRATGASASNALFTPTESSLRSGYTAGVGFGIKSDFLRTDVTIDYSSPVDYRATLVSPGDVTAKVQSTTALFNGYLDLGTWYGLTPYIGAGAGIAFARASDFARPGAAPLGGSSRTQKNFAYAAMAGLAYTVAPNLQIDLGYRYLNIGDVRTPADSAGDMTIRNVAAHEVRVGLRWSFDDLRTR